MCLRQHNKELFKENLISDGQQYHQCQENKNHLSPQTIKHKTKYIENEVLHLHRDKTVAGSIVLSCRNFFLST